MSDRRFLLALGAGQATLLALGLDRHSLWLDEVMSLNAAAGSWEAMGRFFRFLPEQHPLYYVLLRAWLWFGDSEFAIRSLSAITALAATPALFVLARRLTDGRVARIAAALIATSPFLLYYGQEARMYPLLALLAILSSWAFLRWRESGTSRAAVGYVLLATLGMYTHFFFLFLLLAHLVAGIVAEPGRRTPAFRRIVAAQLAVGVAYLPWAWLIATNLRGGQAWKGIDTVLFGIPYSLVRFSVGYAVLLANYGWKSRVVDLVRQDAWILVPAGLVFGALLVLGVREAWTRDARSRFALHALFVPLAASLLASVAIILVGERYYIVSFPFFLILLALGIDRARRTLPVPAHRGLTVGLALVTLVSLGCYYARPGFGRGEWREIVEEVERVRGPGEPVLAHPGETVEPLRYYQRRRGGDTATFHRVRTPTAPDSLPTAYWLLLTGEPDPDGFVARFDPDRVVTHRRLFRFESGTWMLRLAARRD